MKSIAAFCMTLMSIVLILALPGCGGEKAAEPQQMQTDFIIINLLEKKYYDDCHIAGSVNVELQNLAKFVERLDKRTTEIVVYCSNYMCTTSASAWKLLTDLGFEQVWAYEGGTAQWYQLGLPVQGTCKESYLTKKNVEYAQESGHTVRVISAQELKSKIDEHQRAYTAA